jgi:predicted nucleic acid-binding protein
MARPSDLERKGTPIGGYDGPIAGQARSHGLVVVNANLTVFERVAGLSCEDGLES